MPVYSFVCPVCGEHFDEKLSYRDEPHYVRLYINYLRQKLEEDASNPKYILTERGIGYRFVDYRRQKDGSPPAE